MDENEVITIEAPIKEIQEIRFLLLSLKNYIREEREKQYNTYDYSDIEIYIDSFTDKLSQALLKS